MVYKQDHISSTSLRSHTLSPSPTAGQPSKEKKAKHKKDKESKKPCNCFILYRSDFIKWHSQQLSQPEEPQNQSSSDNKAGPLPPKMQDLSVLAGKTWRAMSEAEKSAYRDRARAIVDSLPRGTSSSSPMADYSKSERTISSSKGSIRTKQSKTSKNANRAISNSKPAAKTMLSSRTRSDLPSPPMSDSLPDFDVTEDTYSYSDDAVEYSPCNSAAHSSSRPSKSPLNHQLLTPLSTGAKLASRSQSPYTSVGRPNPMFTYSAYTSPSAAHFATKDVIQTQSNRELSGSSSPMQEHMHYYTQQVAMGYSHADHINNNIMDWTETDIRPTFH